MRKHSVSIRGHRTSFSLEAPFLDELRDVASSRGMTLAALVAEVDAGRPAGINLSSALRLFVLEALKQSHGPSRQHPDDPPLPAGG